MIDPYTPERPNLFSFATSELSQDAFICWLAKWADPQYEQADVKLYNTARSFVGSMVRKIQPAFDPDSIKTIDIGRQVGKLDVLIEVNKGLADRLAILVEDKTHTFNHGTQLDDYYNYVKGIGYTTSQMIPLYVKTGYQSKFDISDDFKPYLRCDFLKILRKGQQVGVQNAIFIDFLAHLEQMEHAVNQFSARPPSEWTDSDWVGFYMTLYKSLEGYVGNWGHVNNSGGGFLGFWWYGVNQNSLPYSPYLQLETAYFDPVKGNEKRHDLSIKISVQEKSLASTAWSEASEKIRLASQQINVPFNITRRSQGLSMTVARMKDDYRVVTAGKLDLDATLANLKKAQDIIDLAFGFERDV